MAEDKHSKTEAPTAKRRKEAKDEGNVPKTQDLSSWLTVLVFVVLGPYTVDQLHDAFKDLLAQVPHLAATPEPGLLGPIMLSALKHFAVAVGPIVLACMVVGVTGHVVQGGVHISSKKMKPKWKKLNPFPGIKSMFGAQGMWTLAKTLIKFVVFGAVAYTVTSGVITELTGKGRWSLSSLLSVGSASAMNVLRLIALTGLVIAGADYIMERRRVEKSLKMTKDEIKRENKMQEGDPHVKGQRKAMQREMSRRRMMASVGESTVVLVNPTHVAVALKYETGGGAPKVVAKGAGHLAARIRQEAEAADVPMIRDPLVTRMLYKLCDIDQFVPPELYDAIAQVIAFVFYLDQMGKAPGTHETPVEHDADDIPEEYSDAALRLPVTPDEGEAQPAGTSAGAGAHRTNPSYGQADARAGDGTRTQV